MSKVVFIKDNTVVLSKHSKDIVGIAKANQRKDWQIIIHTEIEAEPGWIYNPEASLANMLTPPQE